MSSWKPIGKPWSVLYVEHLNFESFYIVDLVSTADPFYGKRLELRRHNKSFDCSVLEYCIWVSDAQYQEQSNMEIPTPNTTNILLACVG